MPCEDHSVSQRRNRSSNVQNRVILLTVTRSHSQQRSQRFAVPSSLDPLLSQVPPVPSIPYSSSSSSNPNSSGSNSLSDPYFSFNRNPIQQDSYSDDSFSSHSNSNSNPFSYPSTSSTNPFSVVTPSTPFATFPSHNYVPSDYPTSSFPRRKTVPTDSINNGRNGLPAEWISKAPAVSYGNGYGGALNGKGKVDEEDV